MGGDEALLGEALEVGLARLGDRQRRLQLGDQLAHRADFGAPARQLRIEPGEKTRSSGGDFCPLGLQLCGCRRGVGRGRGGFACRRIRGRHRRRAQAQRLHQRGRAPRLRTGGVQLLANARRIRGRIGRVELDPYRAGADRITVLHEDMLDDAGLERLQGLAAVADDDPPQCHRDDVELTDRGPDHGDDEQKADRQRGAARRRMVGRVLEAERGRKKSRLVAQPSRAGQRDPPEPSGDPEIAPDRTDHR